MSKRQYAIQKYFISLTFGSISVIRSWSTRVCSEMIFGIIYKIHSQTSEACCRYADDYLYRLPFKVHLYCFKITEALDCQ